VSRNDKRCRVGGVFTEDGRIDFYRALELCFNMAVEFYATLVTHGRVTLAKKAKDGTHGHHVPATWPKVVLAGYWGERGATYFT